MSNIKALSLMTVLSVLLLSVNSSLLLRALQDRSRNLGAVLYRNRNLSESRNRNLDQNRRILTSTSLYRNLMGASLYRERNLSQNNRNLDQTVVRNLGNDSRNLNYENIRNLSSADRVL